MNQSVRKKNIKFILLVSIFIVVGVILFTFITTKNNPFQNLIGNIVGSEVKVAKNDNYNGFYTKKDLLDATYGIFNGCSVYSIDNIILIQDDDYTLYRSSCMGTYVKGQGKTKDLDINVEGDNYVITYKKGKFKKDTTINHLVENNDISRNMNKIDIESLPIIIKETEFEGNYYSFSAQVEGIEGDYSVSYVRDEENHLFTLTLFAGRNNARSFYSKKIKNVNELPLLYGVGKNFVVIEANGDVNRYNYSFKSFSGGDLSYDLTKFFPIKIDGVDLNYGNNSIYIKYNAKEKNFDLLVGNDKKFCLESSNSKKAVAYIFKINYNYSTNKFEGPEYIKSIKGADGCSEIESYLGD